MFFRFDTDRWIIDQLPPVLRRKAVYAFLRAMLLPVAQLAQAFTAFRDAALRRLSTNAFVVYLEKWLNDVFFQVSPEEWLGAVACNIGFMDAIREVIQENESAWCNESRTAADVYRDALFVYAYNCGVAAATGENM